MGFFIMLSSAILGLILLVLGIALGKKDKRWFGLCVLSVICIASAVWLGLPK